MLNRKGFTIFVILAILMKLGLFGYVALNRPQSFSKPDSDRYLTAGLNLVQHGVFGRIIDGSPIPETYRTPGYPLFLSILHGRLGLPLAGVILVQVLLTVLTAGLVYKTAQFAPAGANVELSPAGDFVRSKHSLARLSTLIILFDPASTVYSMLILSDTLFMFFMAVLMYMFFHYFKNPKLGRLIVCALILAASVYIRPVAYYFGIAIAIFFVWHFIRKNLWQTLGQIALFLFIVYGLLFLWQGRNERLTNQWKFSTIDAATIHKEGLWKSYSRNGDKFTQGWPPLVYYVNVTGRCLLSLYTRPASFKYFDTPWLTKAGKVFAYPWMIFG